MRAELSRLAEVKTKELRRPELQVHRFTSAR
jgi:hypothetical protein